MLSTNSIFVLKFSYARERIDERMGREYNDDMKRMLLFTAMIVLTCVSLALLCACGATPTGLSVLTEPDSLVVVQGMTPDLTGGQVTVTYSDGTTKTLPMSDLELSGLNADLVGEQTALLIYSEGGKSFSVTLNMEVRSPSAKSIEVDDSLVKKEYIEGEAFNASGLKVTANLNNDTTKDVTSLVVFTPKVLTLTTEKVRVSYGRAYQEIDVTVREKKLTSLRVNSMPTKKEYYVGEMLALDGLEVSALYDNGTDGSVDVDELTFIREDGSAYASPQTVEDDTVRIVWAYNDVSCYVDIKWDSVLPLTVKALAFEEEQETVVCYKDRDFPFSKLGRIRITYVNDMLDPVQPTAARFTVIPSDDPNEMLLYVTEDPEVKLSVPVEMRDDVVKKLTVILLPEKTEYDAGDTPDLTGILLAAEYESGYRESNIGADKVTTTTLITKDTTKIYVRYGGAEASYDVEVYDTETELQTMSLVGSELKTAYHVGDKVDITGLHVSMSFSTGDTVEDYTPAAEDVTIRLLTDGEYSASDVIAAGTTGILLTVRYTNDKGQNFEKELLCEITLS